MKVIMWGGVSYEDQIDSILAIAPENLRESLIDISKHSEQAKSRPEVLDAFESMLKHCFEYTADVAHLDKLSKSPVEPLSSIHLADMQRSSTHNDMIRSIDRYVEILKANNLDTSWKFWPDNLRASYGKFAINVTLNRLKNKV